MRILMLGDSVYPDSMGGSHRHIHDISKLLSQKGHDVYVFSPMPKQCDRRVEQVDGFTIVRYDKKDSKLFTFGSFLINPFRLFRKFVKQNGYPDVIHGHWPLTCFAIYLYCKYNSVPSKLVYTFHGPCVEEYDIELKIPYVAKKLVLWFLKKIEKRVLDWSEEIQTASHYMREKMMTLYGNGNKTSVNNLFVDYNHFNICDDINKRPQVFQDGKKYIFVLRRLKKRMGIQILLEAFAYISQTRADIVLLIGGIGDYKENLIELAHKLNISDKVVFLGFLAEEEVKYYYSFADVSVMPSVDLEGFGLSTVESMACGTPVVATNVCANTEIVGGITPQLLTSFDPKEMANAILKGIESKPRIKNQLRSHVISNFNCNDTIARYESMYGL